MAKHKLNQVMLVTDKRPAQPPFPGGWVLAIFDALASFAPNVARNHDHPVSKRTCDRIRGGESVKRSTYAELEATLAHLVASLFPTVSRTSKCIEKYVGEYFELWRSAVDLAPSWEASLGFASGKSGVLARALIRDLVLRMGYLECLERALVGRDFSGDEMSLLHLKSPADAYRELVAIRSRGGGLSQGSIAKEMGVEDRTLRRFKAGHASPTLAQLNRLGPAGGLPRLAVWIGFMDHLFRALRMQGSPICRDAFALASEFLPGYRRILDISTFPIPQEAQWAAPFASPCGIGDCIAHSEHLLLHPGFEGVLALLSAPLWRCHLYSLAFGRMHDLTRAYLRFATPEHDEVLAGFLDAAERESGGCPFRWMSNLDAGAKGSTAPNVAVAGLSHL